MSNASSVNAEVQTIWDRNADFWDQQMGEGNAFHKLLIEPVQLEFLQLQGGEVILDAACGNGQFARAMADRGATVIGVDGSPQMIAHAKARSAGREKPLEFRVCDCTDKARLLDLGHRCFDHVVCTMALMDMAEIEPLISASAELLKPEGHFTCSLLHPCFNSGLSKHGLERHDIGGELVEEYYVKTSQYSQAMITKGLAMIGQPAPQYYFHRPLAELFRPFFAVGFMLDRLAEPTFGERANPQKIFDMVFQDIPPALVMRWRLP